MISEQAIEITTEVTVKSGSLVSKKKSEYATVFNRLLVRVSTRREIGKKKTDERFFISKYS